MVKNLIGGNRTKKQKRGYNRREILDSVEQGQMFGQVMENRGDHFMILCADNVQRVGWLSNAAKKGQRLTVESYVVLSLRDYETEKKNCDVIGAADPPSDIKNIFKKINPSSKNDDNIAFYGKNDKFKEFEESETTKNEIVIINNSNKINYESDEEESDKEKSNNSKEWYDEDAKWEDPKAKEDIDWEDI